MFVYSGHALRKCVLTSKGLTVDDSDDSEVDSD